MINNNDKICRICGRVVSDDRKICVRCEETFSLCDIDDYLNKKTEKAIIKNRPQTLLNDANLW